MDACGRKDNITSGETVALLLIPLGGEAAASRFPSDADSCRPEGNSAVGGGSEISG